MYEDDPKMRRLRNETPLLLKDHVNRSTLLFEIYIYIHIILIYRYTGVSLRIISVYTHTYSTHAYTYIVIYTILKSFWYNTIYICINAIKN